MFADLLETAERAGCVAELWTDREAASPRVAGTSVGVLLSWPVPLRRDGVPGEATWVDAEGVEWDLCDVGNGYSVPAQMGMVNVPAGVAFGAWAAEIEALFGVDALVAFVRDDGDAAGASRFVAEPLRPLRDAAVREAWRSCFFHERCNYAGAMVISVSTILSAGFVAPEELLASLEVDGVRVWPVLEECVREELARLGAWAAGAMVRWFVFDADGGLWDYQVELDDREAAWAMAEAALADCVAQTCGEGDVVGVSDSGGE